MPGNDDYFEFMERQFPQEYVEESQSLLPPTRAKDNGAKIVVMSLIGFIAIVLFVIIIKEVIMIVVGLVAFVILLALFAGALK